MTRSNSNAITIGFLMKLPVTPTSLSEPQKEALHMILHVFPGSVLLWSNGKELPLTTTRRAGCPTCAKENQT